MRNEITDSKETITDAKKLLVGDKYSRIVINTKFEPEAENTFEYSFFASVIVSLLSVISFLILSSIKSVNLSSFKIVLFKKSTNCSKYYANYLTQN